MKAISLQNVCAGAAFAGAILWNAAPVLADPAEADWSGTATAGTTVEIENPNGNVFVQRTDGDTVSVRAIRRTGALVPSLQTARTAKHITLCTSFGAAPCADAPLTAGGDAGGPVDELVLIPAGVNVVARAVEGKVVVEHAPGDVQVYTVDGDIDASASGRIQAWTTNGSIVAAPGIVDKPLEFRTKNGSITVDAPKNADRTSIDAKSDNGQVTVTNG